MVLQYDESVRNMLYLGERSGGHVEEADLVERVKSFTKRYPNSRTAHACRAEGGCTPDAIAEAIRSTCRQARRDLFEDSLSAWSPESKAWFMQQMKEAKQQNVETYIGTEDTEETSFISMTLLGISSMYVRHEDKLKMKLTELGLIVDSVDRDDKSIMWKAPYRPEIARADDISVTISFLRNEEAIALWQGSREYSIDGRIFRATEVSIAHDRSFKLRAKRGPWGKGGSLAELSQLLALGGMSTADIARIYQFQLISQCLAAAEGPSPKTYVAVGASTGALQQRELEWVLSCPSTASCEQTLASFRESEAMEGVHLTLVSDDAKLRETFAVELTADTFVPRGKIAKQRMVLRDREQAPSGSFRVQIKSKSSMSTGRFSRKEMEALCGGGNTSTTRVKRAMLELARRMNLKLASIEVQEDRDTLSWDGSLITLSLATKADARRLMEDMPFYLEGVLEVKLEAVGFKWSSQDEEESEEQAQEPQGQQQGAGWLELSDIDRITLEAASPSGPVDQQVLVDLSTMLLETSEEDLLAGKPIPLELDKSVGKLHDTFYSPGNVVFMTLGAWAATPSLGSKRNMLKGKAESVPGQAALDSGSYRPEIASAEEIPVTVSFLRNAQAEKLWQGREDFAIDGRKFTAVHVSIVHDRSFKIRAKRGPWGKGGSLAELTHLLTLGGMTTAEIAAVYRYQLLRQSLAAVQLQPLAGMLVAGAPGQQVHKGLGQKGFIAVGANVIWRQREVEWIVSSSCPEANDTAFRAFRESEAMEGVHLTLFSEDPKIREALAVELTADRFVSRNKLKKASRMQKKAGGKDGKEIKIIIKSTAASGRFTRKEMEGLCNGGNTSIARVKRVLLEIANRLEINVEGIDMEEDLNTKSWNGSKLCILLGSTEDARRMMKELPFYLEGAATKLEAVGFDKEPDSEAAGQRGTSDAAQRQEESEGEWLEFTDLERITMEAASPSSQEDMQLVSELSAVIEDAASLNEAGTS
ncbi:hypothetical protein GUITHDRAFT_120581, partial [Guillardia theta CCMP2712]